MSDTATLSTPAKRSYPAKRQKVPPFARFKGTSAWVKYKRRAHEYARFKEAEKAKAAAMPAATTAHA